MNEFPAWLASTLASLSKADAKRQQDNARLARLQQETRQERRG